MRKCLCTPILAFGLLFMPCWPVTSAGKEGSSVSEAIPAGSSENLFGTVVQKYVQAAGHVYEKSLELYETYAADAAVQLFNDVRQQYVKSAGHVYEKSLEFYARSASKGRAEAQYKMGEMFFFGQRVKKDYAKAL